MNYPRDIYIPKPTDDYTVITLRRESSLSIVDVVVEDLWAPTGIEVFLSRYFEGWEWVKYKHHTYKYINHNNGDQTYDVTPFENPNVLDVTETMRHWDKYGAVDPNDAKALEQHLDRCFRPGDEDPPNE